MTMGIGNGFEFLETHTQKNREISLITVRFQDIWFIYSKGQPFVFVKGESDFNQLQWRIRF